MNIDYKENEISNFAKEDNKCTILVSIIVPIYNVENYLEDTLNDICGQTYTNLQIILIDDGSTDSSGIMCDRYALNDNRIIVIHEDNRGLSAARNRGLELVQGEYLYFMDADDRMGPELVSRLLFDAIENDADIVVAGGDSFYDGETFDVCYVGDRKITILDKRECCEMLFANDGQAFNVIQTKLYKTNIFDNIRFPVGKLHEDIFTSHRIMWQVNRGVITTEQLFFYRHNRPGSIAYKMWNDFDMKYYDGVDAWKDRYHFFNDLNEVRFAELSLQKWFDSLDFIASQIFKSKIENSSKLLKNVTHEMNDLFFKIARTKNIKIKTKCRDIICIFLAIYRSVLSNFYKN